MELDFNILTILDSAGVIQGIVFGLILFAVNKWKENSCYCIGFFLILFSLQRIPYLLSELNIYESHPELVLLPTFALWILSPVFFIYTQKISVFSGQKLKYWLLLPGAIYYVIQIYIFFLPVHTKLIIVEQSWPDLLKILGLIYGSIIAIWNIKYISKHKLEIYNQYAMTEHKELRWAKYFLIFYIVGTILYGIQLYMLPDNLYSKLFFLIFDLILIYWLSFYGILQLNIHSILPNQEVISTKLKSEITESIQTTADNTNLEELFQQINNYMNTSEIYIDTELTIVSVAQKLGIHPRRVSMVINFGRKQNFNSYINQFRIEKSIVLLKSREVNKYSMEGIGNEVGFNSKSSFYAAFKKVTGTTPIKYKEQHAA